EDFLFRHRGEFAEGAEAGVVDKGVDGQALALKLVEKKLCCGRRSQIEGDSLDADALRLQLGGNLSELVSAAGDQDEIVMVAGKEFGQFVSDAARGAGDEYGGGRHRAPSVNLYVLWCGYLKSGKDVGKKKAVARHAFPCLDRNWFTKHRSGVGESMKLTVLAAGIHGRGEATQCLIVEIATDEIRGQLQGICANNAGTQAAIDHL